MGMQHSMWCVLPRVGSAFCPHRDDVAKYPSDCLSPLTSAKSYFSESRYSAKLFSRQYTMAYDTDVSYTLFT